MTVIKPSSSGSGWVRSRRTRTSKNVNPEQRDAKIEASAKQSRSKDSIRGQSVAAGHPAPFGSRVVNFRVPKNSPRGALEQAAAHASESYALAGAIVWPEIPSPSNLAVQTIEEIADIDFEGISEFRTDTDGMGTLEFRRQLEAYFHTIQIAARLAFTVLGRSRCELAAGARAHDETANELAELLVRGQEDMMRLAGYVHAAAIRQACALALNEWKKSPNRR